MATRAFEVQWEAPAFARRTYERALRVAMHPAAIAALIAAVAIAASGWPSIAANAAPDDAYITYRYAFNLAHGHGFVFNPGDAAVQGTSTPLYTSLLALGSAFGFDIPALSIALGAIATAASAALLFLVARQMGYTTAGVVAALLWAASPFTHDLTRGMETPVYMLLMLASLLAALRGRPTMALTIAALVVLTRVDGLALLVVEAGYFALQRRLSARDVVPAMLIVGAWFVFATLYFGGPLPESGLAKLAHGSISGHFSPLSSDFVRLVSPFGGYGIVAAVASVFVVVAAAPLIYHLSRVEPFARMLVAWLVMYGVAYLALGLPDFSWYYGPPAIVLTLLLWTAAERWLRAKEWTALRFAPASAMIAALVLLVVPPSPNDALLRPAQWDAGVWLRANADADATVVAYEIGMVGYESKLHTVDLLGLTEPEARSHVGDGDYAWAIRELRPDYVLTNPTKDGWPVTDAIFGLPEFQADYVLVATFPYREGLDYLLYQRRDLH